MRIGLLGGTFDPIHNGHLYLAKKVSSKLSLEKIIFIPTYLPPHKTDVKITPARHRYNMVRLAIAGNKRFEASNIEIKRKGRSYSVETLRQVRKRYGNSAEIFFITGSDSLQEHDISATDISNRRERGQSISKMVPKKIVDYVKKNKLYPQ